MREFTLPDVGEGVAEGELLEWLVEPGDAVTEDQVVARVETDKAAVDVPSPVNGTVRELHAQPGDIVPVGDVLVTFDEDGDVDADVEGGASAESRGDETATATGETTEADAAGDGQSAGRVFAPPSTRKLARELGVDVASVEGSGPGGRVTEADVRAAADGEDASEDESDDGLKSAVSRIGGDDDGDDSDGDDSDGDDLTSVVSKIDDTGGESGVEAAGGGTTGTTGPEPAGRDRTLAAPATRQVARELDVDLDDVPAVEERDGEAFVSEAAVREYAQAQQEAQAADAAAMAEAGEASHADTTAESETAAGSEAGRERRESRPGGGSRPARTGSEAGRERRESRPGGGSRPARTGSEATRERREPYRGVRKTTGEAMERSKFTAPHVTHHDTVDVTALVEAREKLKPRAEEQGVNLTYLPFVMKAVVAALKEHPVLNTSLDEANDEVVYKNYYDIGVATATDAGLMVPVVENVDGKGLVEIGADVNELTAKARDRSISREELQGSTFTITNFGTIGGEYATPIINYPETAVLGLGAIKERPWVHDGEVVPRKVLTLSLSIDHRVVDGADAARFVNTVKESLEDPTLLLLE